MDYLEFAAEHSIEGNTLSGVVHVFGTTSKSVQKGSYHRFEPTAFDDSIKSGRVLAFYAHDTSKPLAKPSLSIQDGKLHYSLTLGSQSYANDLRENMANGLMNSMSFGVTSGKYRTERNPDGSVTRVHSRANLYDISPVAQGDFEGTEALLHSATADRRADMARARFRVAKEAQRT